MGLKWPVCTAEDRADAKHEAALHTRNILFFEQETRHVVLPTCGPQAALSSLLLCVR